AHQQEIRVLYRGVGEPCAFGRATDVPMMSVGGAPRKPGRRVARGGDPDAAPRALGQLARAAVEKDETFIDDEHSLAQSCDVLGLMCGKKHGLTLCDARDRLAEAQALLRIKARRWFVEHEQ